MSEVSDTDDDPLQRSLDQFITTRTRNTNKDQAQESVDQIPDPQQATMTEVTIAGIQIKKNVNKKIVTTAEQILFHKEERENLTEDKRQSMFKEATAREQKRYSFLNVKLKSDNVLQDSYNLD